MFVTGQRTIIYVRKMKEDTDTFKDEIMSFDLCLSLKN